jgi:NADPH-dependent 2,4-dienoyl-CoA reductase/sulfur reductase-like enzyme
LPCWSPTPTRTSAFCGIPYHISGDVPDWRSLAHRTIADLEQTGLRLLLNPRATAIDPNTHTVTVTTPAGDTTSVAYDRLIIGTGAVPARPPIAGLDSTPAESDLTAPSPRGGRRLGDQLLRHCR